MAKMHACSMVLNQRTEGEFEKRDFKLFSGAVPQIRIIYLLAIVKGMAYWGEEFQSIIPKLKNSVENFEKNNLKNIASTRGLNVLMHGDVWFNNVFLEEGDNPDVLLIDFQTVSSLILSFSR